MVLRPRSANKFSDGLDIRSRNSRGKTFTRHSEVDSMRRRRLLSVGVTLFGGCSGDNASGREQTTQAGSPVSSATEALPDVPKPIDECTPSPLPDATYPPLPSPITDSSASDFALEFEKSYASATLETRSGVTVSGFDGWQSEVTRSADSGCVVRTTVHLDFVEEESSSVTVAGSETSYGWYYVTDGFAVRASGDGSGARPTSGWETVACR